MKKHIVMGIDIADHWWEGYRAGYLYDAERMRQLIRTVADCGIAAICWRVDATGRVSYRSNVRTPLDADLSGEQRLRPMPVDGLILKQCDPPQVAVEEARRCGLSIFAYMTLFDEYYPGGGESAFEVAHPQYAWKHRVLEHRIRGLPSYFYPEVREHRLAQLRELIAYGFDGVYLDTARTHAGAQLVMPLPLTGGDPYIQYGYNKEEVEAYQNATGQSPPEPDQHATQPDAFHRFRGTFLTQFLREARDVTRQANVQLHAGVYTDASTYLSPAGRRGRVPMGWFHHDVGTWIKDGLLDGLNVLIEHRRYGDRDWRDHTAAQFAEPRRNSLRVFIQAATQQRVDELADSPVPVPVDIAHDRAGFLRALEAGIDACLSQSADGVYLYDAIAPERRNYWHDLKRILSKHT